jgi:hypothetical protein
VDLREVMAPLARIAAAMAAMVLWSGAATSIAAVSPPAETLYTSGLPPAAPTIGRVSSAKSCGFWVRAIATSTRYQPTLAPSLSARSWRRLRRAWTSPSSLTREATGHRLVNDDIGVPHLPPPTLRTQYAIVLRSGRCGAEAPEDSPWLCSAIVD